MDLSGRIGDLIVAYKEMRNHPSVNKQWLNKTISRLEEAEVFAQKIVEGKVLGITSNVGVDGSLSIDEPCICPIGAVDRNCRVHGQ